MPIRLEGCIYHITVTPGGEGTGAGSHISVFLWRDTQLELRIECRNKVANRVTMLHKSGDAAKNFEELDKDIFDHEANTGRGWEDFYPKVKLSRNGFIHDDGSLRFEFAVKKSNYRERFKAYKKETQK